MIPLPTDCWSLILGRLDFPSLQACRETSRYFRDLAVEVVNQQGRTIMVIPQRYPYDHSLGRPVPVDRYPASSPEKINQVARLYRSLLLTNSQSELVTPIPYKEQWHCPNLSSLQTIQIGYNGRLPFNVQAFSSVASLDIYCLHGPMTENLSTFTNLRSLKLRNQPGLELRGLTGLTSLTLQGVQIRDINPNFLLLTQLQSLSLQLDYPGTINVLALTRLRELETLCLIGFEFTEEVASLLHQLPRLTSYTQRKQAATKCHHHLSFPTNLTYLDIHDPLLQITVIEEIAQLPRLETLKLDTSGLRFTIFPPVASPRLREMTLKCRYAKWTDLTSLVNVTFLGIDLTGCSHDVLAPLINLRHLALCDTWRCSLDLSQLSQLETITLRATNLDPVSFFTAPRVRQILFYYYHLDDREKQRIKLANLDVEGMPFLHRLKERDIAWGFTRKFI